MSQHNVGGFHNPIKAIITVLGKIVKTGTMGIKEIDTKTEVRDSIMTDTTHIKTTIPEGQIVTEMVI